jgi:sulfide:quinone oxidoreductase
MAPNGRAPNVADVTDHLHIPAPHRVVIAGGGVAGLEALVVLRQLAGDRVAITLLCPTDAFSIRALSVESPFARPAPSTLALSDICAEQNAEFRHDALHAVHPGFATAITQSGEELPFDSLLVAVGAQAEPALDRGLTFRGMQDAEALHGLIQDVEGGYTTDIAFVVPPGVTWPLPIYELALMTAERADSLCLEVNLTIVTPEPAPLAVFGPEASRSVARTLAERGVHVRTGRRVALVRGEQVVSTHGDVIVAAQRVVALPRLAGPRIRGIACDEHGFVIVDEECRVRGTDSVFAAGDGTTVPVKQGGIAAQQADAAAHAIARRAGADVAAAPFHVELEWPPTKVAAPYLAPYLARLRAGAHVSLVGT